MFFLVCVFQKKYNNLYLYIIYNIAILIAILINRSCYWQQ